MPNKMIKNSYNSGEQSPLMDGRTDLAKYYTGCSKMANFTPLPYGGAVKRSGSEYITTAKTKCKLLEFEFSANDNMIIEAGNLYFRFYQDSLPITIAKDDVADWNIAGGISYSVNDIVEDTGGGIGDFYYCNTAHVSVDGTDITDSGDIAKWTIMTEDTASASNLIYEIQSPYTSTEIFDVHLTQSADVLYMTHTDHPPQKLSRLAVDNWTIADVEFSGGPFLDVNVVADDTMQFQTAYKHTAGTSATVMTDATRVWTTGELVGRVIFNLTDGSSGAITANTATTVTVAALTDGVDDNWELNDLYSIDGYFDPDDIGILEATGHEPFQGTSLDVGTQWSLETTRTDNVQETEDNSTNVAPTNLLNAVLVFGDLTFTVNKFVTDETVKLWRKEGNGEWQEDRNFIAAASFTLTEDFKDVYYAWSRSVGGTSLGTLTAKNQTNRGIVEITLEGDTNTATVKVIDRVQQEVDSANSPDTTEWAEGAWGQFRGYPITVTFYEDRLWWASTTNNPQSLWGSRINDYQNMARGILADDPVAFTIQDNNMSSIQWIAARKSLIAGTANKEYAVRANSIDDPIKPNDVKASPQSTHGSDHLQPVTLNDGLFYVQRSGRKMWIMRFSFADEQFDSTDATLLAEHLFEDAPVDMASQGVPESIVWVVRSDGTLLPFNYNPEEEVAAWSRHVTGTMSANLLNGKSAPDAQYESVAVIGGDIEDEIWVSVKRVIESVDVRYIEKFTKRFFDEIDEAVMLDSATIVASANTAKTITVACDTIRYNFGTYNSGVYGGSTA